jgi:hypothetical protein
VKMVYILCSRANAATGHCGDIRNGRKLAISVCSASGPPRAWLRHQVFPHIDTASLWIYIYPGTSNSSKWKGCGNEALYVGKGTLVDRFPLEPRLAHMARSNS